MKVAIRSVFVVVALLSLAGCGVLGGGEGGSLSSGKTIQSDRGRATSPDVDPSDLADLVSGNSAFAFGLYQYLCKEKDGNLIYSPHSISLALAMTYAGARGETERQMADTLHFTLPQGRLHPAFNSLDLTLGRRGAGGAGKDGWGFRLNIVNAIWGQDDYKFLPEFLDTLAENYGAGLRLLDFKKAPEESRVIINKWVREQTEGRIKDLVPQGAIDEWTRLVLTNAIYFNAAWADPFNPSSTRDGPFHLLDGSQVTIPMMEQIAGYGYARGAGYQAVELPYDGKELSMVIILPAAGAFEAFEASLDAARVDSILKDLVYGEVALTMPKFEIESDFRLRDVLAAMGMPEAFVRKIANFSGMDDTRDLFIWGIVHRAFISLDEAGTEAAAATAVVVTVVVSGGVRPAPIRVTVDRPFLFLIRDIETGAILFLGRVVDPSA